MNNPTNNTPTNPLPETTGERINELIKEKGIQKKTFALDIGVTQATVSYWISNKYTPNKDMIRKIAKYFNVLPSYISCKTAFKNYNEKYQTIREKTKSKDAALYELLKQYGYTVEDTGWHTECHNLFNGDGRLDDKSAWRILKVITPDNKLHYILEDNLNDLLNDFFASFEARLISKNVSYNWPIFFDELEKEGDIDKIF